MDRTDSHPPPRSWEEAYELLERVVEGAKKQNLFAPERSDDEVISSIVALLAVDSELSEIGARMRGGPHEYLDLLLLSPEDEAKMQRVDELLEKEGSEA